jgi:hypothetical protein
MGLRGMIDRSPVQRTVGSAAGHWTISPAERVSTKQFAQKAEEWRSRILTLRPRTINLSAWAWLILK